MPGTGFYDIQANQYRTFGLETWDTYDGSSAGTDWNAFTTWQGTSGSSLQFTSGIQDQGIKDLAVPIIAVSASAPVTTTVIYGDTIDSAGGAIDSANSQVITPNTATVTPITARYYQFQFDIAQDSAGFPPDLVFNSFAAGVDTFVEPQSIANLDTSTLAGSVGERQLDLNTTNTVTIKAISVQPLINNLDDSATNSDLPVVFVDKAADPPVLHIFNVDAYGKRTRIDCTVDIIMQKLISYATDSNGNTQRIT